MGFISSQMSQRLYNEYKDKEVIFTKEIIRTLKMDPRQIYVKAEGSQWPCIINSTSFTGASIIIGTNGDAFSLFSQKEPPKVSLKFSFFQPDGQILSFFIAGKISEVKSYMNNSDLSIIRITYTHKPPEDLIQMIGYLLDANANYIKRKEDRIIITQDSLRKLGIPKKETIIYVQNVPRNCIIQDLSFGGAKVVFLGVAQFIQDKEISLVIDFDDPAEKITLKGVIINTTLIKGRKDIIAANIKFHEDSISLSYKIHINNYLTSARKDELNIKTSDNNLPELKPVE